MQNPIDARRDEVRSKFSHLSESDREKATEAYLRTYSRYILHPPALREQLCMAHARAALRPLGAVDRIESADFGGSIASKEHRIVGIAELVRTEDLSIAPDESREDDE